jgi:hypothetical protein
MAVEVVVFSSPLRTGERGTGWRGDFRGGSQGGPFVVERQSLDLACGSVYMNLHR